MTTTRASAHSTSLVKLGLAIFCAAALSGQPRVIPKTWDESRLEGFETPPPLPGVKCKPVPADYYYKIPVSPIYKTYPVYAPSREPEGYINFLRSQEPEIVFDAATLKTDDDWLRAGEEVFSYPTIFAPGAITTRLDDVRDSAWYKKTRMPIAADGSLPIFAYVIREKGKVELGSFSCATCHTRLMQDGSVLYGGQSNFPIDAVFAQAIRDFSTAATLQRQGTAFAAKLREGLESQFYAVPWLENDPLKRMGVTAEAIAAVHDSVPPGVMSRQGSSPFNPPRIPDLFGVRERKYFDSTGLNLHRDIGDLMRFSAINQGAVELIDYNGMFPAAKNLPAEKQFPRYSDEQLYALSLYVYSLKLPPNPNKPTKLSERGRRIFELSGCGTCHSGPQYSNNELVKVSIIGTDPRLTMETRRATGYYKVPSLRGAWARGPFEHNGSIAELEDWFEEARLRDGYHPTGFVGYGVETRAVKGHEFGLNLKAEEKQALVAFLRTL